MDLDPQYGAAFDGAEPSWHGTGGRERVPGKRTLTERMAPVQRRGATSEMGTPAGAGGAERGGGDGARGTDDLGGGARMTALFGTRPAAGQGEPRAVGPGAGGAPLPEGVQRTMEAAFGADLSTVRVHIGGAAQDAGARAYTQGEDIHFAPGQFDPESAKGKELLGHELTHVMQNRGGGGAGKEVSSPEDGAEQEATRVGAQAASGARVSVTAAPSAAIQRVKGLLPGAAVKVHVTGESDAPDDFYEATIEAVLDEGARYQVKFTDPMVNVLVKAKAFDEKLVRPDLRVKEKFVAPTNKSGAKESILSVAGNRGINVSKETEKEPTGGKEPSSAPKISVEEQQRLAAMRKYMETKGPWNNCGNTARNLVLSLQSCGGQFAQTLSIEIGVAQLDVLRQLLDASVSVVTLIDIAIFGVHEFTIEKHPDGRVTLSQGYQGQYSAFWFAGLDDHEHFAQPKDESLVEARKTAGGGQQLPEDFNQNLTGFLEQGSWDAKGVGEAWKKLPMHPKESLPKTDNIRLKVEVWTCKNAEALFKSLDGDPKSDFLCQLVLKKELKSLDALKKDAGAIGLVEEGLGLGGLPSDKGTKRSSSVEEAPKETQVEEETGARARYKVGDEIEGSEEEIAELLGVTVQYAKQRLQQQRKGRVFTMANICWGVDNHWLRGENFERMFKLTRLPDNSFI